MAIRQVSVLGEGLKNAAAKIRKNPVQLMLAIFLVMCCGATKKFQTFPMVWIAGQSKCQKVVSVAPTSAAGSSFAAGGSQYSPVEWIETKSDCTEKAKVFTFVTESFTITTANLVFFGIVKACFNFVTGVLSDRYGRKFVLVAGWVLAIPMPFMVIYATGWWTVAFSNVFLGMQQALVWSVTIFIMIDYLGQENSGLAIGLNETVGYTTIAIVTQIAVAIMDEDEPRTACYYVVMVLIFSNIVIAVVFLKESKPLATKEEAEITARPEEAVIAQRTSTFQWPSGRSSNVSVAKSAFIYTSFVNRSLMSICFAGLMVNFISGFSWGLFKKWMKDGQEEEDGQMQWAGMEKQLVADIVLCYGLPKGLLQVWFGLLGDRFGRKWFVTGGLAIASLGLMVVGSTGVTASDPRAGFFIGALLMGVGTGVMYSNNLAAIVDHSDPSWRASALGAYRFWRDMGYAVGALMTGAMADSAGIPWSVGITAMLTALAALTVAVFYREVQPDEKVAKPIEESKAI